MQPITNIVNSFSNFGRINIADSTTASPYPSTINVNGLAGTVRSVRVTLNGISHTFADDIDIMLVGPGGQRVTLMSDAGGFNELTGQTLTFASGAPSLPDSNPISSGTYQPTNYGSGDNFPSVGVAGGTNLGVFNGSNPNGAWRLYVVDDLGGDVGAINSGWTLTLDTQSAPTFPLIRISDTNVIEGNNNFRQAVFNVTLSSVSPVPVTVNYRTANGSARGLSDYLPTQGVLSFSPGQRSAAIRVPVFGDFIPEANENFFVNLSNARNALIADNIGVGTIFNDDFLLTNSGSEIPSTGLSTEAISTELASASSATSKISADESVANLQSVLAAIVSSSP